MRAQETLEDKWSALIHLCQETKPAENKIESAIAFLQLEIGALTTKLKIRNNRKNNHLFFNNDTAQKTDETSFAIFKFYQYISNVLSSITQWQKQNSNENPALELSSLVIKLQTIHAQLGNLLGGFYLKYILPMQMLIEICKFLNTPADIRHFLSTNKHFYLTYRHLAEALKPFSWELATQKQKKPKLAELVQSKFQPHLDKINILLSTNTFDVTQFNQILLTLKDFLNESLHFIEAYANNCIQPLYKKRSFSSGFFLINEISTCQNSINKLAAIAQSTQSLANRKFDAIDRLNNIYRMFLGIETIIKCKLGNAWTKDVAVKAFHETKLLTCVQKISDLLDPHCKSEPKPSIKPSCSIL